MALTIYIIRLDIRYPIDIILLISKFDIWIKYLNQYTISKKISGYPNHYHCTPFNMVPKHQPVASHAVCSIHLVSSHLIKLIRKYGLRFEENVYKAWDCGIRKWYNFSSGSSTRNVCWNLTCETWVVSTAICKSKFARVSLILLATPEIQMSWRRTSNIRRQLRPLMEK